MSRSNSRVTICDDPIEPDLVKVRCLKLQHLMYAFLVDPVCRCTNFFWCAVCAAKPRVDELLAVFVQEVKGVQVGARRDLDQLCKAIPDLCGGEGAQEGEIKEGVHRCMISTKAVLVVAIVDSNLNRH